jgi:hypothetical protein
MTYSGMMFLSDIMRRKIMERFLKRHKDRLVGSIAGFDRLLFRGVLRSISYVEGLNYFMGNQRVPFKDFKSFVEKFSAGLKVRARQIAERAGRPFLYVASGQANKEKLARAVMERDGIEKGLICVLSCVEPCQTFTIRRDREKRQLQLVARQSKCLHFYFYFLDREFGLMHLRLQSWLPLTLQVCVNGREWLARQMQRAGIEYEQKDNCFTSIADLPRAQALMDRLVDYPWAKRLNRWAEWVNPWLGPRAQPQLRGYYWTVRQGEYATDVMFRSAEALAEVYPALCRHAIEQFSSPQVLRFLGRRTNSGFNGEVCTTLQRRVEGVCIKHRVEENSIKMYDKQGSVLRVETTLNNPQRFRVYRRVTRKGQRVRGWYPLRKGIVDLRRRVELSRAANARYLEALAVVGDSRPSHRILDPVSQPLKEPRPYRALRPISPEESRCFAVLLRGEFHVQGIRNRDLWQAFILKADTDPARPRQVAARVTRYLRLLRAHGLIYRVGRTYYYRPTQKGYEVMTTALKFRQTDFALLAA